MEDQKNVSTSSSASTAPASKPNLGSDNEGQGKGSEDFKAGLVKFLTAVLKGLSVPDAQHSFYIEALRLGAIGNIVSHIIMAAAGFLAGWVLELIFLPILGGLSVFGGANIALPAFSSFSLHPISLVIELFWAAIYGAIGIFIFIRWINRYWPKFLGKTLFAKLFYLNLLVSVVLGGLLSMLTVIFVPIISVSIILLVVGGIVASYASAKIIAGGLEKKYPEILSEVIT